MTLDACDLAVLPPDPDAPTRPAPDRSAATGGADDARPSPPCTPVALYRADGCTVTQMMKVSDGSPARWQPVATADSPERAALIAWALRAFGVAEPPLGGF